MLKLIFTLLTDPMRIPANDLLALGILIFAGIIIFFTACGISPWNKKAALRCWTNRLLFFTVAVAVFYALVALIKWVARNFLPVLTVFAVVILFLAAITNVRHRIVRSNAN